EAAREMNPTGLLLNAPRPNILRFMPALNVTTEEIDTMIGMLRTLLTAHASASTHHSGRRATRRPPPLFPTLRFAMAATLVVPATG
ncbi:hypothetical protein ABTL36_19555, partial [Acinetobacter baumannii]